MASCNFPVEGRPPDSPPNRKYKERKCWSHPSNNLKDDALNNNGNNDQCNRKELTLDPFLYQKRSNYGGTDAASSSSSSTKNRNSFIHQDVEEALSSLLWQPYEYQNKVVCSPSGSSCASLSDDLDNNKESPSPSPSTASLSCCSSSSSSSSPTPDPSELVVNNLKSSPSSVRIGSPRPRIGPRDSLSSWHPASRLSGEAAIAPSSFEYFASDGSSDNNNVVVNVVVLRNSCSNSCNQFRGGDVHEEDNNCCGDMQFEVSATVLPDAAAASLSSANVVGLPRPHHPRNVSEPHAAAPTTPYPQHSRSASVPKTMPITNNNNNNVSNVNVNFYRAVPVNVVSAVPTIQCLNTNNAEGNSVSNVQIVPVAPVPVRTFTSTEAQTDEVAVQVQPPPTTHQQQQHQQRRKERRDRRKRSTGHQHHRQTADSGTQSDRLPDLLNTCHLPPPYSPPPPAAPLLVPAGATVLQSVVGHPSGIAFPAPPPPPQPQAAQVPLVQAPTGFRFPFPAGGFRRGRFSEEPSPKGCCGLLSWKPGSLRWFIAVIALVAVCCVLVGTALGAMRPAGRDHLTVSLLMIGVGIVLVTVSGVAWRLTSHDSSTCRSMLGLGSTESVDVCTRRFVPRLPPSYGRPHHPYAAMMYPEFQYRPPPPSYQASMQEYRLRLLLLDRGNTPQIQNSLQNAVSPPPTYRSHAGSLLRAPLSSRREAAQSEYSCPPSYRSQNSTVLRSTAALHHANAVLHSREQSLSLSDSNTTSEAVVNVVNILASTDETDMALVDNITLDSLKLEPDNSDLNGSSLKMLLKSGSTSDLVENGTKDGNLVTIVQTNDQNPVIVTVSGSSQIEGSTVQITEIPTEMEILAHL